MYYVIVVQTGLGVYNEIIIVGKNGKISMDLLCFPSFENKRNHRL